MLKEEALTEKSTKENIMRQAFILMSEKGIKDISMREVAEACGVTKPVIYYYFRDKDDLCYQLISNRMEEYNEKLSKLLAGEVSFKDVLVFIFSKYIYDLKDKRALSFILHFNSYISSNPEMAARLVKLRNAGHGIMMNILQKEYEKGALTVTGRDLALHLILANIAHVILHCSDSCIKFGSTYPKDMARAVLVAVEYKGEKE